MTEKLRPNPMAEVLEPPPDSEATRPHPRSLLDANIRTEVLRGLAGRSLCNAGDLSRDEIVELCRLGAFLESTEITPYHPLDGKVALTAFFEASTRTRLSFESAIVRLDGRVLSIPDANVTGVKKGESLEDIGEMFNAYGDLVVMRHTETDALGRIQRNLRLPLINAGNGTGEHPTQALADWYALLKWRPALAGDGKPLNLRLGILGTPGSMRAVKSFLLMSLFFQEQLEDITVVSEMADPFGEDVKATLDRSGVKYGVTNDVQKVLPSLDVIYMNSIAFLGDSYKTLDTRFKLDARSPLKEDAVILHPLARRDELDVSLDQTTHNLYWSQAHGAVFVRQALLISIFNRFGRLPEKSPLT